MPTIRPVSELRNYGDVLREVTAGSPVFLTKNGHGRYALLDMEDYQKYEKWIASQRLLAELDAGRRSGQEQGYLDADAVFNEVEGRYHD